MANESRRLARLTRTGRLFAALLQGRTLTAEAAAELLVIKIANARRQLTALEGVPGIVVDREARPMTWRLDRSRLVESPAPDAAIAACFGASLAPLFEGTKYARAMTEARDLVHRLSKRKLKDLDRKFLFLNRAGDVGLPERPEVLEQVLEAVLEHWKLLLHYSDFDGTARHELVKPLTLVVYDHQLYLVGERETGELHPFRFSRIALAEVQKSKFQYPARTSYEPRRTFASSFGVFLASGPVDEVVVLLDERWSAFVESHEWHRSQTHRRVVGGVQVTLTVRICPELEAWILGFGAEAEVLKPLELRHRIEERLRLAAERYGRQSRRGALT